MKWLVTAKATTDLGTLQEQIERLGCQARVDLAIPLDRGEVSIEVEGPAEHRDRLRQVPGVTGVFPNSALTLNGNEQEDESGKT